MAALSDTRSTPLRLQYMSDLHLEFESNRDYLRRLRREVTGDILIVAGDCLYLGDKGMETSDFCRWAADHYERVMLIPGNHEYYGGYDLMAGGGSWEYKILPNVGYYCNRVVTIGGTDIILSSLWTHIPPEQRQATGIFLNDFHRIKYGGQPLSPDGYNAWHARCLGFITRAVAESNAEHRVVVTHHVPTRLCTPRKLRVIRGGSLESAFTVDLTDYIRNAPIDYWIYGHSHVNLPVTIGGTTVTANQLGYVFRRENEWNGFDFGKCIVI